jgi:hypothetical protein
MQRSIFLVAGAVAALAPLSARAEVKLVWKTNTDLKALAVDHAGDVVGVGKLSTDDFKFGVTKLDGASGKSRWRVVLRKTKADKNGSGAALAVGPANEVFAVGAVGAAYSKIVVTKLTAAGKVVWSSSFGKPSIGSRGTDIVVDSRGDVIASGYDNVQLPNPIPGGVTYLATRRVAKLAGSSGKLLWTYAGQPEQNGGDINGSRLKVDSNGDVFVYGPDTTISIRKLSGGTGAVMWQSESYVMAANVTGHGDLVIAGAVGDPIFQVAKLSGDGHLGWHKNGCIPGVTLALTLVDGDAIAAFECGLNEDSVVVVRFNGASGQKLWERKMPVVVTVSKDRRHSQKGPLFPEFLASMSSAIVIGLQDFKPIAVMGLDPSTGHTIWEWKDLSSAPFEMRGLAVRGTSVYLAGEDLLKPHATLIKLEVPCGVDADTKTDRAHCGSCDRRCPDTQICVDGRCEAPEPEECVCRDGTRVHAGGEACQHACRDHDHPGTVRMPSAN